MDADNDQEFNAAQHQKKKSGDKKFNDGFNINFFRRFWRLHRLFFPSFLSLSVGLFAVLLLLALAGIYIV